jgi:intermembrane space import and assembly protein 40
MGQIQSDIHHQEEEHNDHVGDDNRKNSADTPYSSMDALIAEATAMGDDDESESLDVKAQKALECPCVAELRDGPCGEAFTEAFVCFIKSQAEEKGSDCVSPFIALQKCVQANKDAFAKYDLDDNDTKDGESAQEDKGSAVLSSDAAEHKITPSSLPPKA